MSNLLEFHKPGKAYKQVKAETVRLPDASGKYVNHRVMVYMTTAGTPAFAVGVPLAYANAWRSNRDESSKIHDAGIYVTDGAVSAGNYPEVLRRLERIAYNYHRHICNLTMRKVIRLVVEVKGAPNHGSNNAPSFSNSRVLVGIRSGVYWEVNGGYYIWDGDRRDGKFPFGADLPGEDPGSPAFSEMRSADMQGNPITIQFTPEAWATVQEVENMLERAAGMLLSLAKPDTAQVLLEGGLQALQALTHTEKT